ncbi:Leucine-rich repeat domain superfamily [Sesbania bispinosa]|nr:Leucine-rich repeat domain superfamily [Sesbania bispinosa]
MDEYRVRNWRLVLLEVGGIAGFVFIDSSIKSTWLKTQPKRVMSQESVKMRSLTVPPSPIVKTKKVLQEKMSIHGYGVEGEDDVRVEKWFRIRGINAILDLDEDSICLFDEGTKAVKGLSLRLTGKNTICLNTKAFDKLNRLRLLQLAGVRLNGDFKHLAGDLRWLCWRGFPLTYAPAEIFQQGNLVAIELKYSNLKQMWKKSQMLENLKVLNLSHSKDLTKTPDFSYLPNLEKLVLKDCPSLTVVSHTIGYLHKLVLINLKDCTGLGNLPRSIYKLKSLETLILSGCSMIDKLEEDLEQMECLTTLIADNTAITKVPFSIVRSKSIGYISLCGFEGFSRHAFPHLIWSWMSPTNNLSSLDVGNISSLVTTFDVPNTNSYTLSYTLKDLPKLRSLYVRCASELQLSRDVARILDILKATNWNTTSPSIDCCSQVHISESKNSFNSLLIQMGTKSHAPNNLKAGSIVQTIDGPGGDYFSIPGDKYSDWFTFNCNGSSITFDVPQMNGRNLKRMMLRIIFHSSSDNITSQGCQNVLIINYTKTIIQVYKRDTLTSFENEEWQSITSNFEPGNRVEVIVVCGQGFIVEKTAIYLLYDESINEEIMEHCHTTDKDVIVYGDDDHMAANRNVTVSRRDENTLDTSFPCSRCSDFAAYQLVRSDWHSGLDDLPPIEEPKRSKHH